MSQSISSVINICRATTAAQSTDAVYKAFLAFSDHQTAPAARPVISVTIPGILSVTAAAERGAQRGPQNGGVRISALNAASAATDMLLYRVAILIMRHDDFDDADIEGIANAADGVGLLAMLLRPTDVSQPRTSGTG